MRLRAAKETRKTSRGLQAAVRVGYFTLTLVDVDAGFRYLPYHSR